MTLGTSAMTLPTPAGADFANFLRPLTVLGKLVGLRKVPSRTRSIAAATPQRLAPFADKHKIWVAFHNHTNNYPVMEKTDPILAQGQYIGFNFDVGHANSSDVAEAGYSAEQFVRDLGARIVGAHVYERESHVHHAPENLDRIGDTLHELIEVGCAWWTARAAAAR